MILRVLVENLQIELFRIRGSKMLITLGLVGVVEKYISKWSLSA